MFSISPVPSHPAPPTPMPPRAEPESPRGCWLESSRELLQGMRVIEHAGFERISFEVPLAWQLAGY